MDRVWIRQFAGIAVAAVTVLALLGVYKLKRLYVVVPELLSADADVADLERGLYLATVRCAGWHGSDFGCSALFEDLAFMPWPENARMTDEDLTAGFQYLQSLPSSIEEE